MLILGLAYAVMTSAPAADAPVLTGLEFLGFSADEQYAAWRRDLRRDQDRSGIDWVDTYSLRVVTDTRTGKVVGTFRASDIWRQASNGMTRSWRLRKLVQENPDYARAKPAKQWEKMQAMVDFAVPPADPELGDLVQVASAGRVRRDGDGWRIEAGRDLPLSFDLRVTLTSGDAQLAAATTTCTGTQLTVYTSPSGHHVALLATPVPAEGQQCGAAGALFGLVRRFETQRVALRRHRDRPDTSAVPQLFYAQRTPRWSPSRQRQLGSPGL